MVLGDVLNDSLKVTIPRAGDKVSRRILRFIVIIDILVLRK